MRLVDNLAFISHRFAVALHMRAIIARDGLVHSRGAIREDERSRLEEGRE